MRRNQTPENGHLLRSTSHANPAFVETLTVEQAATVLIHELNHALRAHPERARAQGVPHGCMPVWKVACDLEINDDLEADDLDLPGLLLPEHFDLPYGHTAERYYQQLINNATTIDTPPHCGSAPDHHHGDSDSDEPATHTGLGELERRVLRKAVAQAVIEHDNHTDPYGDDDTEL